MLATLACVNCKAKIHMFRSHAHLPGRCPKCGGMLTAELRQTHRHPIVGKPEYLQQGLARKSQRVKLAALVVTLVLAAAAGFYLQWESGQISKLVGELAESDSSTWGAALERLVNKGGKAVPALIEALSGRDETVRARAKEALTRIGKPALKPVVELLTDEHNEIYQTAASIIKGASDAANLPELLELFQGSSSPGVQEVIAEAFELLADKRCIQVIVQALKSEGDPAYNPGWNQRMDARLRKIILQSASPEASTSINLPEATGEKESWLQWWQEHRQLFD